MSSSLDGHCVKFNMSPLDKNIFDILQYGKVEKSINKLFTNKNSLEIILNYEKNLHNIVSELQPSLERLFPKFSCRLHDEEISLSSFFFTDEKSDILSKAREMGGGQFVDMLWATGLAKNILNSNENITLIVPLSISNIPDFIRKKIHNACLLRQMLKYHMVPGKQLLSSLKNNDVLKSLYETESIYFNKFNQFTSLSGALVKNMDIEARNGVIHVVETFILPPAVDTISLLEERKLFSIFVDILKDDEFSSKLKDFPHTYFVVTDSNINNTNYILKRSNSDKFSFVLGHIVPGFHFYHSLRNNTVLTAVDGSALRIAYYDGMMTVNDNLITTYDLFSRNGIVHVIENTL
ncbi:periostin-like [Hydra vulgaris]|uniref:Periostin-like n=1 Tax=Hydra vulgaris TaxID=6087 RepID=A0ABM4BVY2_HYDVU